MSVKNILAAYSGQASKESALKHAVKVAKQHDAWVSGVISHHGQPLAEERFGGVTNEVMKDCNVPVFLSH